MVTRFEFKFEFNHKYLTALMFTWWAITIH